MNDELSVFRRVDFRSVRLLKEVWVDSPEYDINLQEHVVLRFEDSLDQLRFMGENQLGLVVTGVAGSGKTHTLGQIRRKAMAAGAYFVLIDCTDILQFWPTLALQYLQSLQQEYVDEHGVNRTQIEGILSDLVYRAYSRRPAHLLSEMSKMDRDRLIQLGGDVVAHLKLSHATRMQRRHGTVRALFYLYSGEQSLSDLAYAYVQGQKLESSPDLDSTREVRTIYLGGENSPKDVVSDLAWLMSLSRPTVLAFDQLDPIVTQHRVLAADENHESQAIIQGVVNGLMSLMDTLERTLPLVFSLEVSWETLRKWGLNSAIDRFQLPPVVLVSPRTGEPYERIIRQRLDRSYRSQSFTPPYPTWPIAAKFFDTLQDLSPREVLNRCERHRQACLVAGAVSELSVYNGDVADRPDPAIPPEPLDAAFLQLKQTAGIEMPSEENEDKFGRQLADVCEIFLMELPSDPDIDYQCEHEFHETTKYASLHVRLRRIFRKESDREEHVCVRVLEKAHWKAFQVRLAAARTMSGVTEGLAGRTLVLLRNGAAPGGSTIQKLIDEFRGAGGRIEPVNRADLVVFSAVQQLQREFPTDFEGWLRHSRPLSQTALFQRLVPTWLKARPIVMATAASGHPQVVSLPVDLATTPAEAEPQPPTMVLVGLRDGLVSQPIEFPTIDLTRHVVIRAGSGGGKTVLLKRLVEEAALASISSVVIDSARDLSFLGDPWPERPEGWLEGDGQRADRYMNEVRVRIWTPGRREGRPIFLSPLPDFRSGFDDQFEFDQAVQIATDSLGALLVSGRNRTQPMAVLQAAVKHFALQHGHELQALADLLHELPESATPNISRAPKLALEMGDQLNALMLRDPMLSSTEEQLDIGELFGAAGGPRSVSVISLFALNDLSSQTSFVGRLAMAVFDWIRRNPARDGLRGLFVVDEAAPFLPRSSSESKPALMLLSQQARKYGVGLLLATQNPMDLDYNATAQFATQFFGTANQPQVVRFIEEVMEERGLRNLNPASLKPGSFYVSAPSLKQPIKLQVPMCLSWHPRNRTLTDEEILDRARRGGPQSPS